MSKKLVASVFMTLAALAIWSSASAHNITGNAFLTLKSSEAAYYVAGFSDAYEYYLWSDGKQMPEGVTLGQMVAVITQYVVSHPKSRHLNMSTLSLLALAEAFPRGALDDFGPKK